MRILFVCHRFPFPPKRGGKIRPFNIIRHLHSQGHEVTVASLARSDAEARDGAGLAGFCHEYHVGQVGRIAPVARMVLRLPTLVPSSMGYFYSPTLAARIREVLRRQAIDMIFVHCSSVAQYVEHVRDVPKLIDIGDMDSQKWLIYADVRPWPLSWGYRLEGLKLMRAERRLAGRFDFSTCTTRAELQTLRALAPQAPSDWFPNGVDADFFQPGDQPCDPDTVSFIGRMDYFPNQQAVRFLHDDVLPLVRRAHPAVKLQLIGAAPPEWMRRLAANGSVVVTGTVPDVRPWVQRSALSCAPLAIARGTQNKILESMAMGVPVVCSENAAGGVDAVPGEHLLTARTAAEHAEAILSVLADPARRRRLAAAARSRVLSHHDWQRSMQRLDGLVERCVAAWRTRRSIDSQQIPLGRERGG